MTLLGIDIGGTRIKSGLVRETGELLVTRSVPTPVNLEGFRAALRDCAAALADGAPAAVGVGCKGIIDPETTRIDILPGTLRFAEGLLLSEMVLAGLPAPVPVRADNDARVAMAGEAVWGAARGRAHALMLTLGTGVGGAIIADGKLLRGHKGVSGHLGHLTMDPDGPLCICGNRGCLETFFSARAIEAEAVAVVHRGCDSVLTRRFAGEPLRITCRDVFDAAGAGDTAARGIVDRGIQVLGAAIAGLLHAFDPEIVIVGGNIAEAGEALFAPLRREVAWRTRVLLAREVPIVPPQVADKSGVIGAAALALFGCR
jgi:glucokinase